MWTSRALIAITWLSAAIFGRHILARHGDGVTATATSFLVLATYYFTRYLWGPAIVGFVIG